MYKLLFILFIKDDQCFQYAATFALNYREIKWSLERISYIKS